MQEINDLDRVRINEGNQKVMEVFFDLYTKDKKEVFKLLNDDNLSFPTLYLLFTKLEELDILRFLNSRNKIAYRIAHQIVLPRDSNYGFDYLGTKESRVFGTLRWMLETGYRESYNGDYEKIMDITASVLIDVYEEKAILPIVADAIFMRNKMGHYTHDLIWAFFRFHDPLTVKLIAERMLSEDKKDVALACSLLGYDADKNLKTSYDEFHKWIKENDDFLYFTEENLQFSSKPIVFKIDKERKYLQKPFIGYDKKNLPHLNDAEKESLVVFSRLLEKDKEILLQYSNKLHLKDRTDWKDWIAQPVQQQLDIAHKDKGDYV